MAIGAKLIWTQMTTMHGTNLKGASEMAFLLVNNFKIMEEII